MSSYQKRRQHYSWTYTLYCPIAVLVLCYITLPITSSYSPAKITNLVDGKVWLRNENQCIVWEYSDPDIKWVDIRLMCGDSRNGELKHTFITNFDVTRRAYHFIVSPYIQPRNDYFVQMICYSSSGRILEHCYTGRFEISHSYGTHTEPVQEAPKPPPVASTTDSSSTSSSSRITTKTVTKPTNYTNPTGDGVAESASCHFASRDIPTIYLVLGLIAHLGLILPFIL